MRWYMCFLYENFKAQKVRGYEEFEDTDSFLHASSDVVGFWVSLNFYLLLINRN